jgi:hypothetical protein
MYDDPERIAAEILEVTAQAEAEEAAMLLREAAA